ncbi:MAG: methylenetetrahydrofolate reductase C-terminal domain-containing protein [Candidatus Rokuibacteriota bacterium]
MTNPLRDALATGRFCYVVELVASALTREARLLEAASGLARIPAVVAGSVTSYAGGAIGHDPLRVAAAARARGLTPNIHLTCVSQDRRGLAKSLDDMRALSLENVFALTGDYPSAGDQPPVFDLDSVQLVRLIDERRRGGMPFHVAVAVSPFKYTEADCVYQYVKLEKKIAAGADVAVTQVGWDARKFAELKRYLDERGLRTPVLGNVYVLGPKTAERMATGRPPGCWVSPELLAAVRDESRSKDGGRQARLERAARTVAVLRGLGYAGAYLGGTHDAAQIGWIIRRADELAPSWDALAAELGYGAAGGFYLQGRKVARSADLPAKRPRAELLPRLLDRLGRAVPVKRDSRARRALTRVFAWIDRWKPAAALLERAELAIKKPLFGCQACGNCVLGHLEYVCPQTCPKQLRNGPCGGTDQGRCEVVPDQPCIWVAVYDRAKAAGALDGLKTYVPMPDRRLRDTSSWINYFLERDSRPGAERS